MLWLALALVAGQWFLFRGLQIWAKNFGSYTESIRENTEALLKTHQHEIAMHHENIVILKKLLNLQKGVHDAGE